MSQITVTSDLVLRRDSFVSELRAAENDIRSFVQRVSAQAVRVPITAQDQITRAVQQIQQQLAKAPIALPLTVSPQAVTNAVQQVRQQLAASPVVVPVVYQATGAGSGAAPGAGATGAAGGGGPAAPANMLPMAGRYPFLAGSQTQYMAAALTLNQGVTALGGVYDLAYRGAHLGDRLAESDPLDQLRARRALIEQEYSGPRGLMNRLYEKVPGWTWASDRLRAGVRSITKGMPVVDGLDNYVASGESYEQKQQALDDAERQSRTTSGRVALAQRAVQFRKGLQDRNEDIDVQETRLTAGDFAGRRAQIALSLKRQQQAADDIEDGWRTLGYRTFQDAKQAANQIRSKATTIAAAQHQEVDRAAYAAQAGTDLDVQQIGRSRTASLMVVQGRSREAALMQQRAAISDRVTEMEIAWRAAAPGPQQQQAHARYAAAAQAATAQTMAVEWQYQQQRDREEAQTQYNVGQSGVRVRFDRIRAGGTAQAEHEAALAERDHAAGERARQLALAASLEPDQTRKGQLGREQRAAEEEARVQRAANAARELRRIRQSVSDFIIGRDRAELSEAERDYGLQTKIFEKEWDRRIEALQTAEEKQAAMRQRGAEREARSRRHAREVSDIRREGTTAYTRAAGNAGLAEAIESVGKVQEELRQAGGDMEQRRAIAFRSRGRLQEMAQNIVQPQMFNSWSDVVRGAQESALSGRGSALGYLQAQYSALGQVQRGSKEVGDRALSDASKKLDAAADKLAKQTVFVLKD